MRLKSVVADDEPLARERLKLLLAEDPEIEVVAECRNGREAILQLQSTSVDLLFLDIQMPGSGGFEVIEAIGSQRMPPTVFVTAHQEFAVKAFAVHALDYLTKPIEAERLRETLSRVRKRIAENAAFLTQERLISLLSAVNATAKEKYQERFLVRDGTKDVLIPVDEIEWIEAADYYSCLHVKGRKYMLRQSIKQLGTVLDPAKFVRIHRSAMVRMDQVGEIHRDGEVEYCIVLKNGQRLKMSKAGWKNLVSGSQR
jgi:two-component system LytT family response regulator